MNLRSVVIWLIAVAVSNIFLPTGVGLAVSAACFIRFLMELA